MQAKLADVAQRVANRPRPRVFFEVRELNLLAAGQGSLVNDIITRAGGENVVTSPQKLTLVQPGGPHPGATRRSISSRKGP